MSRRGAVLVTGGAGYLGSLTVEALRRDRAVVSLDVRAPAADRPGVTEVVGDLRETDLAALIAEHGVTDVVHLAAILEPPAGMAEDELRDIEVGGARRVLEACARTGVAHVTVTSSGAAYGYRPRNRRGPLTEDDPTLGHPRFAYSRHKAEVEALVTSIRAEAPGLAVLLLRPGTILGEHTDSPISRLLDRRVLLGLTDTDVPFVFVLDTDVAEIVRRGVDQRLDATCNVAGDGVLTLRDIAAIEGRRMLRLPPWALTAALAVGRRLGLTAFGPEQVDFLRYRPVLANDALKAALPGLPSATTAEVYARFRAGRRARAGT